MKNKTNKPKVSVKSILNDVKSQLPVRQHKYDAGFDLTSIDTNTIKPGYSVIFGTGLYVEVPKGFVMLIFPRSGLGVKHNVTLVNSVGVIDSGYRGEVKVDLINLGQEDITIHAGDRIAQAIVFELPKTKFIKSFILNDSEDGRNTDGFGSTDKSKNEIKKNTTINNKQKINNKINKNSTTVRRPNKKTNVPVKAYNGNMLIHTFKSISDAVDWLNNNNPTSIHYRTNIKRVMNTNKIAYGYSWRSASVKWVL